MKGRSVLASNFARHHATRGGIRRPRPARRRMPHVHEREKRTTGALRIRARPRAESLRRQVCMHEWTRSRCTECDPIPVAARRARRVRSRPYPSQTTNVHDPLSSLTHTAFPTVHRSRLTTPQVNLGCRCSQSCEHRHVGAGPNRTGVEHVMYRHTIGIDRQGRACGCDFDRMPRLPLRTCGSPGSHVADRLSVDLAGRPIAIRDHCFGCTSGQRSSGGGALG